MLLRLSMLLFFHHPPPPALYTLSLHDALPISSPATPGSTLGARAGRVSQRPLTLRRCATRTARRSEEHTSELQSLTKLVCRLLLEKKKVSGVRLETTATLRQ